MSNNHFDVIVIGGGAGGLVAMKTAQGFGKRVAVIEKNKPGGECTWTGCVPSKALIKAAEVARYTKTLSHYGLDSKEDIPLDTSNVMPHIQEIIQTIYKTHTPEILEKLGIAVFIGSPKFIDQKTIVVNQEKLTAKKFIIATGSSPFIPPIEGLDSIQYHTNETIFSIKQIPHSMTIIGGGAIGIELAGAFKKLGSDVTVIEQGASILPHEDTELSQLLTQHMKKQGIKFLLSKVVKKVEQSTNGIIVHAHHGNKNMKLETDLLLIATGRKPNVDNLDLEKAGIKYTNKGIKTNNTLCTSNPNTYACGDVVGPYQFSHMADYQAVIAARNACIPVFKKKIQYGNLVWVTFSDPEFAHLGLTESQALEQYGNKIHVYRTNFSAIDRPLIDGADTGMAKIITDKRGYIIGAHILGARAGELIHELEVAKYFNKKLSSLNSLIHAYPTYCDVIKKTARVSYVSELKRNPIIKLLKKLLG